MNHKNLLVVSTLALAPLAASALPVDFFAPASKLEAGNWVKIGITETGVYEISYDSLREMGFANPQAVAVYGRGGRQFDENFVDSSGKIQIQDDLSPVRVSHADNKIYFYGLGVEDISFVENTNLELGGSFIRNGLNIYSNYGYYFLTDSAPALAIEQSAPAADEESPILVSGAGYVYHEKDLAQNNTNTGQLFWGENYFFGDKCLSWEVDLPGLIGDAPGAMQCVFYNSKGVNDGVSEANKTKLGYGVGTSVTDGTPAAYFPVQSQTNTTDYIPQEPSLSGFNIPAGADHVFVEYVQPVKRDWDLSSLDHWVLTYSKSIPDLISAKGEYLGQDLIAFPEMTVPGTAVFELQDPTAKTVWDVTNPYNPVELAVTITGDKGIVTVERTDSTPVIAIFDRMATQKNISGFEQSWEKIANQNIHALRAEGADMAIITLPWLKEAVEELAQIHEEVYGNKVVVVTAPELYNEFSGGLPDPMAYRSFAKMMYTSPGRPLKNLMLVGPLYCDMRGIVVPKDPDSGLIAFQTHELNLNTSSMNANDFYVMMTDRINTKSLEKQTLHMGLGVLPIYYTDELRRYNKKVRDFATDESFAYRLNSNVAIGGIGDNHVHGQQAVDLSAHLGKIQSSFINTVIAIDAYGYDLARAKWYDTFNNGRNIAFYFGHGGPSMLGQNRMFFNSAQVPQFKNKALPFMSFYGCSISDTDHGVRGLGESMIFDTEHGLVGGLVATRSTWSGQNMDFAKLFQSAFYVSNPNETGSALMKTPQTLGQIYSRAKNFSVFVNELAFQLLADPGIIFPVALQKINAVVPASVTPGETVKVSGTVLKIGSSAMDTEFNGEVVVRLLEPEFTLNSDDLVTLSNEATLKVPYGDEQASMSVAKVVDGKFEAEVFVPQQMAEHKGRKLRFNLCAYNPVTRIGATNSMSSAVNEPSEGERPDPDVKAPVIEELVYDRLTNTIKVVVSDDVALDLSRSMLTNGFQAYIDGNYSSEGSASQPILDGGPRRYTRQFYAGDLSAGHHSAHITVRDASGNQTDSQITFMISPESGVYTLRMRETGLDEQATFYVDGNAPETATIYVTSPDGTTVAELPYALGEDVVWDGKDMDGNDVPTGRYRAFLRETGSHQSKGHADVIIVPVI